jgi:hypothetical protein
MTHNTYMILKLCLVLCVLTMTRYGRESGYNSASSGYNSATSHSSNGSARSQRSTGSTRSAASARSANSRDSQHDKYKETGTKKSKKSQKTSSKKSSKSKSPTRKRKTKRDHFQNNIGIGLKSNDTSAKDRPSVLDLYQSETRSSRTSQSYYQQTQQQDVGEVLGSYLQEHEDSEAERTHAYVQDNKLQQLQHKHQHQQQKQQQQQEQYRQDYEQQEQMIANEQQAYMQATTTSSSSSSSSSSIQHGKPPLRHASQSSNSTPQQRSYPIDEIEDDSDETDSNLDSDTDTDSNGQIQAQGQGRGHGMDARGDETDEAVHRQFLGMSAPSAHSNREDETEDISKLRSHLLQSVTSTPPTQTQSQSQSQTPHNSLATSTTSLRSVTDHHQQHQHQQHWESKVSTSSENNSLHDSLEKENHPNIAPSGRMTANTTNTEKQIKTTSPVVSHRADEDDGDVSDIDRRLSDLQKFLDKARLVMHVM